MNKEIKAKTPVLEQSVEDRLQVYQSLPKLGGDPQNTGESVNAMVDRVKHFASEAAFVSVVNIRAID